MKKPTGSKFLLKWQVLKVIEEIIPRMQSVQQCDDLQADLDRFWRGGKLDDARYQKFSKNLAQVRMLLEAQEVTCDV